MDTNGPTFLIHQEIERLANTLVALRGMGTIMDAAVAEMLSNESRTDYQVRGVIRLVQIDDDNCAIDGTIDGLTPGDHALTVNEYGDISNEFKNLGNHYNPLNKKHGLPTDQERHLGDLGNITADADGRSMFRKIDKQLKLMDIIGRSVCIYENADLKTNELGEIIACGIVARSAKVFDNVKKICLCSGKTLWDERESAKK